MIDSACSILVTGGCGFIGSHLVERLVEQEAKVTVVDNYATGHVSNLASVISSVRMVVGELGDVLRYQRIKIEHYDYIFHLAANPYIPPSVENPVFDFHENLENTFALLEAIRTTSERPHLVNVSTAAVYGNPVRLPIQEGDPTVPISPYGVSKLAAERYVSVYSQLYGLHASSVRLFSVYGPRQKKQVVFDLYRKLRENHTCLEIFGNGSQERDFTYVLDVVNALILVAQVAPGQGEVFNVASGISHSIGEVAAMWCKLLNVTPEIQYTGSVRPGDAEKWTVDISALSSLGFKPQTTLEEGLIATQEWYGRTFT